MLLFVLKSTACLAIFLAFYKLLLEKESIHNFKRFYLLGALFLSFGIPLVSFTEYIETETVLNTFQAVTVEPEDIPVGIMDKAIGYLPSLLWSLYGLGVLLFGAKFAYNLARITKKIRKNPKQRHAIFTNVLLQDLITPHTFFNYIFLNKNKFENHLIPKEVMLHEESHAKQKHSIDIIFIELLQIIFWFNPLIYLSKKAIKLNHEFLADEAVLNQGIQHSTYQQILLSFSSNAQETPLAHAINYSLIKKRFTIMKTQTSKKSTWLRSLLLLPLLGGLLFGFSSRELVHKENLTAIEIQDEASSKQVAEYNKLAAKYNAMSKDHFIIKKKDIERLKYLYNLMSSKQRQNAEPFPVIPPPPPSPVVKVGEISNIPPPPPPAPKVKVGVRTPDAPPPPPIPENVTLEQRKKYKASILEYKKEQKKLIIEQKRHKKEQLILLKEADKLKSISQRKKQETILKKNKMEQKKLKQTQQRLKREQARIKEKSKRIKRPHKSTLDQVTHMAKKNATFFYNGKKISLDKAIELVKKNNKLNISSQTDNGKSTVHLSEKGITIKH